MTAPAATQVRSARKMAVLLAPQPTEGTAVSDFTLAIRLWTAKAPLDGGAPKADGGGLAMTTDFSDHAGSRYIPRLRPFDKLVMMATPESVKMLLRSNWGPFAAGAFTLKTSINELFTLALVESTTAGDGQKVVRVRDVFFHRMKFLIRELGPVVVEAEYHGRASAVDTNAAVTLPALEQDDPSPADSNVFSHRLTEFRRDPGGVNVDLEIAELALTLDQRGANPYAMTSGGTRTYKMGKTKATATIKAKAADENWAMIVDARAGTKRTFRTNLSAPSPASLLRFDMHNMDFDFVAAGPDGRGSWSFEAEGAATASGGSFVDISLT